MAAFEPEYFCRAADVPMVLVQLFKNIISFVSRARLMQSEEVSAATASVAINQWWQMLAIKVYDGRIHDDDALDHIAKLANISRPGIAHQAFNGIVRYFAWPSAIASGKLF
jgi:hypothetical protein